MPAAAKHAKLLLAAALATAAVGALSAAGAQPPAPAQPPPFAGADSLGEGPGGRTALARWTLALDPGDRGLARGWPGGAFAGASVSVPAVVDPLHLNGAGGRRNYGGSIAWYRTSFTAAGAGTYALRFSSVNYRASVWIDGRAVAAHRGSYLPFEARAALATGTHVVVVRVDWRDPAAQSREGFHRTWFNWGGINGAVSVRAIGASELSDARVATTLTASTGAGLSATVTITARVQNNGPPRTIAASGSLARGAQAIALHFPALALAHGQSASTSTTVVLGQPALWSPSSPSLYQLSLGVEGECSYLSRIGVRQLRWRGGAIYLNGQRLQLHGASLQEDAPGHGDALSGADQDVLVAELRASGANAVRTQHPLDPGLLERLDAAGIVVWQGIGPVEGAGNWYSQSPRALRAAVRQAQVAAAAAWLHPSIIAWNLADEVAGNGRSGAEVSYVQTLAGWLHASDPDRLVAVDVWGDHPPVRAGALYRRIDAISQTDYTGWYDEPTSAPMAQVASMRARLRAMERTFPGRVLLISEFGAESNALNAPAAPGGYAFQSRLLERHIDVYRADPRLSGMFIWDLRDYPLVPGFEGGTIHQKLPRVRLIEGFIQKGLFTYTGQAKPAAGLVARLFGSLGPT